ncbi:MAG: hypothetical protein LC114_22325, partial [Bryobacterales bacterium]|nr:hypothetical protein [Bryobacterales bacterium]
MPGFNQTLVANSYLELPAHPVSSDGRLRLRGQNTLDICTTRGEADRAIRQFARGLDYLAADGIGVELRQIDGWRTCAIVDGEPIPIRVRERM